MTHKSCYLVLESTHEDWVPGELAHVGLRELPDLRGDGVLLHEGLLGEVELQGVVWGQRDEQPPRQVLGQGVAVVVEEQGVVGQGGHGDADLGKI